MATINLVISVLGQDRPGIVAAIAGVIAAHEGNIADISQTVMQGLFTMIMLVTIPGEKELAALRDELVATGERLGVQIMVQREEVFRSMHRV